MAPVPARAKQSLEMELDVLASVGRRLSCSEGVAAQVVDHCRRALRGPCTKGGFSGAILPNNRSAKCLSIWMP